MQQVVDKSIKKLRKSLSEVRYSIYALKPYPTQRLGLKQAIINKVQSLKQEYGLAIHIMKEAVLENLVLRKNESSSILYRRACRTL